MKKIKLDYPDNALAPLGGNWDSTSYSGSRCSDWFYAPSVSGIDISARGISNHYKG